MQRDVVFSAEWQDRRANLRASDAEIARLRSDSASRVTLVWNGRVLVEDHLEPQKALRGGLQAAWFAPDEPPVSWARSDWLFLGEHDGHARFVAVLEDWVPEIFDPQMANAFFDPAEYPFPNAQDPLRFVDLRGAMTRLEAVDAAMFSTARAVFNWHKSHQYCAACGTPSQVAMAGWQRNCPNCGTQHFPRTDPVVIMLVTKGDMVLLGRSPGWPEGRYSALAGFVEPGESIEAAVRREVVEETGVRVGAVSYVASQPWAWPNSLMIGCVAEAESTEITLDDELEDAVWVSHGEMQDVILGHHPAIRKPLGGAIAGELLHRWVNNCI